LAIKFIRNRDLSINKQLINFTAHVNLIKMADNLEISYNSLRVCTIRFRLLFGV